MTRALTTLDFIEKSNNKHGHLYDYSLSVYINGTSKVDIICQHHGIFKQSPAAHSRGQGCPICAYSVTRIRTNIERYGVASPTQNKDVQAKTKQTNIEKYGVEWNIASSSSTQKRIITNLEKYGVNYFTNRKKAKQTNLERYGVDNPTKLYTTRQKMIDTCLQRYGVESASKHTAMKDKTRQTNLTRYGCHPRQTEEVKTKQKQTNLERYGVEFACKNKNVQAKTRQTTLNKYGTSHYNQKHMVDVLPLIEDYDWLFDQYIVLGKTAIYIAHELGVTDTTIGNYLRKLEIEIRKNQQSYVSKLWLDSISNQYNISIDYEYRFCELNKKLRADGYCQETNTIYEFHGDYWHGNPKIYSPDYFNKTLYKTMGELYQKTIEREELIKSLGYNLVVMWEKDFIQSGITPLTVFSLKDHMGNPSVAEVCERLSI